MPPKQKPGSKRKATEVAPTSEEIRKKMKQLQKFLPKPGAATEETSKFI